MNLNRLYSLFLIVIMSYFPCIINGQNTTLDSLKLEFYQESSDSTKAEILAEIGDLFYEENFDSIVHYYNKAYSLSESIPYYKIQLSTLRSLAYVHSLRKNDYDTALVFLNKAVDLSRAEPDSVGVAYILSDIGRIHWKQGKPFQALEHHLQVKSIGEQINNAKVQLRANLSLGVIENENGHNDKAKQYYHQALFLADSLKKDRTKGLILNNLGNAFQDDSEYEIAYNYFRKADSIFTKLKDNGRLSLVYSNLGKNYNLRGNPEKGIVHFKLASNFNEKIRNKEREVMILSGLAQSYQQLNKPNLAISTAEKALNILKEIDTELYYDLLYEILVENYEKTGNHTESLKYYKYYFEYKKKINEVERTKEIANFNHLYALEKKENKILELKNNDLDKERKLEQTRLNMQIIVLGFTLLLLASILIFYKINLTKIKKFSNLKDRLSKDLHDNIGASLNHIKMLSNRMSRKALSDTERENTVLKIKRISDELLYNMHDMVWVIDEEKENVGSLLGRIQDYTDNTLREFGIPFKFNVERIDENVVLSTLEKINIYMIFKESINNILKHAETEKVIISFSRSRSEHFRMLVSNYYSKRKESSVISNKKGILNMKKRAQDMGGQLRVVDKNNNFKIELVLA